MRRDAGEVWGKPHNLNPNPLKPKFRESGFREVSAQRLASPA